MSEPALKYISRIALFKNQFFQNPRLNPWLGRECERSCVQAACRDSERYIRADVDDMYLVRRQVRKVYILEVAALREVVPPVILEEEYLAAVVEHADT